MLRLVAPLTLVLAALTVLAALATMMIAIPLAMATMIMAFGWYVERPGPQRRAGLCTGCRSGCVECRERIEIEGAR